MIQNSDVATSRTPIPTIYLEDVSAIPFVEAVPGVEEYQHRARVRADTGSLFVASTERDPDYEHYNRALGLGAPDFIVAEPLPNKTEVAKACLRSPTFEKIVSWVSQHPRWAIHPYMSIAPVWELAEKLSQATNTEGFVIGPNVDALWTANDKQALSNLVARECGPHWIAETVSCHSAEQAQIDATRLLNRYATIGVKRTRCASAMGNMVVRRSDTDLDTRISQFLVDTKWASDEPILIVEWLDAVASPSTQLWIPLSGDPVVEGVYEQLLEGDEKVFLGSRPSTLPDPVNSAISEASLKVADALQRQGYVGRCSFDFVVEGDLSADFRAVFTECNGRWGGTSTPMFLVDRLLGTDRESRPMYRAQDVVDPGWKGATFSELHAALADLLFQPAHKEQPHGRYLLYNVGPLKNSGKFDVIAFGRNRDEADDAIDALKERLRRG